MAATYKIVDNQTLQTLQSLVSLKSQHSAHCLAIVVVNDSTHQAYKAQFYTLASASDAKSQITGALCLGEYGKLVDLSGDGAVFSLI